jgi:hypothetical protein
VVLRRWKLSCATLLLTGNVALVVFAQPMERYLDATVSQLFDARPTSVRYLGEADGQGAEPC